MAYSSQFSEFVIRAKAVAEAPDNYHHKNETLGLLPKMKVLAARGDAMAQYQLAQVYPKNSPHYLKWMEKAATQGCTNAMLVLSKVYAKTDLQLAAAQVIKIFASDDSYIKDEVSAFVKHNRRLGTEVSRQINSMNLTVSSIGFFAYEKATLESQLPLRANNSLR